MQLSARYYSLHGIMKADFFNEVMNMETYKKPVVASKRESSSQTVMPIMAPTFLAKKLFGDDDFHPENSRALTTRKAFTAK